jgi:O-Antigen ligase
VHENAQWSDLLVALAALSWLDEQRREGLRLGAPAELALALFVVLAGLSLVFAPAGWGATFGDFVGVGALATIAFLTSRFAADKQAFQLIVLVVAVTSMLVVGAALLGLALFYAHVETSLVGGYGALLGSSDYARVQAALIHPALLGSYCIFASAVVAQGHDVLPRRLRQAAQVALAVTAVLTFSRAILGFALAALIRFANTPRRRAVAAAAALACVAAMAVLSFAAISLDPSHPFDLRVSTAREPVRSQELTAAIDTVAEHPLLGTGPGSLPGEAQGYGRRQAHNTPVGVAATLGIPALLMLIAFLALLWRDRSRPTNRATWGGLAGLGVDGLGQDIEHFRHVWVLLGLAWAQSRSTTSRLDT